MGSTMKIVHLSAFLLFGACIQQATAREPLPHWSTQDGGWRNDKTAPNCQRCTKLFDSCLRWGLSRHHCRSCGLVICRNCTGGYCPVDGYWISKRVCNVCFDKWEGSSNRNAKVDESIGVNLLRRRRCLASP